MHRLPRWRVWNETATKWEKGPSSLYPECLRHNVARATEASQPRVALALRGESFRNVGGQHMRGTCGCAASLTTQRRIYMCSRRGARYSAEAGRGDAAAAAWICLR